MSLYSALAACLISKFRFETFFLAYFNSRKNGRIYFAFRHWLSETGSRYVIVVQRSISRVTVLYIVLFLYSPVSLTGSEIKTGIFCIS